MRQSAALQVQQAAPALAALLLLVAVLATADAAGTTAATAGHTVSGDAAWLGGQPASHRRLLAAGIVGAGGIAGGKKLSTVGRTCA